MMNVLAERVTADVEGELVVFLIGMRINRLWKIHKWLPVALAMPRMIRELSADPELGVPRSAILVRKPNAHGSVLAVI